ncbi:MAG TPA: tRNA 4-thiouridine(8) synthase ThiI, partial [Candidatus Omnitrophota bacterium]|nr:tRNA 4-thiouridine(8) synthase ThiI [Candidatus Omnitrophota bacterium]
KQGIDVIGINFLIPFKPTDKLKRRFNQREFFSNLDIKIKSVDFFDETIRMIRNPKFGLGHNLNPCIDCHILMLQKAKKMLKALGASFVVTGEVLGQRPMSQNKHTLELIERKSGLGGLLLRPLSAKLLNETLPEKEDWVKRSELLDFSGRTRSPQFALAKELGVENYATPAGGCLLTDRGFSVRMRDLLKHNHKVINSNEIELLKFGRHFRLGKQIKLVVGRDHEENEKLIKLARNRDYVFEPKEIPGPVALARGRFDNKGKLNLACRIISRYSDSQNGKPVKITLKRKGLGLFRDGEVSCLALDDKSLEALRV